MNDEPQLAIGLLAKATGINVQTARYYERRRILTPARRTGSGYRLYDSGAVKLIHFIRRAQRLGFSLDEIALLLRLRVRNAGQCAGVRRQAELRLRLIQERMSGLRAMANSLKRLIGACVRKGTTETCPMLESLRK